MKGYFALLLFGIISFQSFSQIISFEKNEITFHCNQASQDSTSFDFNCQFKSFPDGHFEWIQKRGALVYTFLTVSFEGGEWSDLNNNGHRSFTISKGESRGVLFFEKSSEGFFITLRRNLASGNSLIKFNVQRIEAQ